jgi:hypothetical protein
MSNVYDKIVNYTMNSYNKVKDVLTGEYHRKKEIQKIIIQSQKKKQEEQNNYVSNKYLGYNNLSW